jgi:hypothetical protein
MKKVILAAAASAIIGITSVKAQTPAPAATPAPATAAKPDSLQKTTVKVEELPDAVKATLQSDVLKVWTPSSAALVKSPTAEYYQVNVKKDNDERFIRIGKDGKIVQ